MWVDKAERLIAGAAAYGSQIVVFPEAFVGGYPHAVMFEGLTDTHLTWENKQFQMYFASAIDVPGAIPFYENEIVAFGTKFTCQIFFCMRYVILSVHFWTAASKLHCTNVLKHVFRQLTHEICGI